MALECVGSVVGPPFMGQGRDWFGEAAMFTVGLAAVSLVLVLCGVQSCIRSGRNARLLTALADRSGPEHAETLG
jgi:hypothetical protein